MWSFATATSSTSAPSTGASVLVPRRSGSHEARIRAGGVEQDVTLTETGEVNDELDNAYRTKYGRYAANIIDRITSPDARAATLELVPT
jgi:hypothetical protein